MTVSRINSVRPLAESATYERQRLPSACERVYSQDYSYRQNCP
jgi:hypothetical protein